MGTRRPQRRNLARGLTVGTGPPFRVSLDPVHETAHESAEALIVDKLKPANPPEDRPTYVLVHGLGVSSWYFEEFTDKLCQHAPVVELDLPGFGRAREPDDPLHIDGLAASLVRSIEELQSDDIVLVGHSMGVQVVVEALIAEPGLARAALLMSPVVDPRYRSVARVALNFAHSALLEHRGSLHRSVITFLTTNPLWIAPHYRAMMNHPVEDRIAMVSPEVNLMLLSGENDPMANRAFLSLLQRRTRHWNTDGYVAVRTVPGASHHVMGTHPEAVVAAALELGEQP